MKATPSKEQNRLRLISNISFVRFGNLRLKCSAILLVDEVGLLGERDWRIRGFDDHSTRETFTLFLKCSPLQYVRSKAEDRTKLFLGDDRPAMPLFSGEIFHFADGAELFVQLEDRARPPQEDEVRSYEEAWGLVLRRSLEFHRAPNFPMEPSYERTEFLKIHFGLLRPGEAQA